MKNLLITGANGFIGGTLKRYFLKRNDKYNLLIPSSSELDLLNSKEVHNYFINNHIDIVFHCAYRGVRIGVGFSDNIVSDNVTMFRNLVLHSPKHVLIFNIGSGAEYDKSRALHKVEESAFGERVPNDYYGYSKYIISKDIQQLDNVVNLRIFGVFGPYEHPSRFPYDAISHNVKRMPIVINRNVIFSYLFIDDLCRILEIFCSHPPKNRFLNIAPDETVDLITICEEVNSVSDFRSEIVVKNHNLNLEYTGSNKLLRSEITFEFTPMHYAIDNYYRIMKDLLSTEEHRYER
jgi:GDP-L-fucose synthase